MDTTDIAEEYAEKIVTLWRTQGEGKYDSLSDFLESDEEAAGLQREIERDVRNELESEIEELSEDAYEKAVAQAEETLGLPEEEE